MLNLSPEEILSLSDFKSTKTGSLLEMFGYTLDLSFDEKSVELIIKAFLMYQEIQSRKPSDLERVYLDYFASNYWSYLLHLFSEGATDNFREFCTEKQLFLLRESLLLFEVSKSKDLEVKKRILTNLANTLSNVGRTLEGIEYWNRALKIDPDFGMALGNLGDGLCRYAYALYDAGQAKVIASFAQKLLKKAVNDDLEHPMGEAYFKSIIERSREIFGNVDERDRILFEEFEMGNSQEETEYRRWCLRNVLFLNPLNDLGEYSVAARDVLGCPSVVSPIERGPEEMAFFNAIKQEFVSARWLFYSGINRDEGHFSDRGTFLLNTLDNPVYGLNLQEILLSIRSSFSVLDKIAFFVNKYFDLEIPDKRVNFSKIWERIEGKKKDGNENSIMAWKNPFLHSLRWVSKDLEVKGLNPTDPLAADVCEIRNCSEHRYLKVHVHFFESDPGYFSSREDLFRDSWAFHISLDQLRHISLKALKLSRAAIIYLSMSIESNERQKRQGSSKQISLPVSLPFYWAEDRESNQCDSRHD